MYPTIKTQALFVVSMALVMSGPTAFAKKKKKEAAVAAPAETTAPEPTSTTAAAAPAPTPDPPTATATAPTSSPAPAPAASTAPTSDPAMPPAAAPVPAPAPIKDGVRFRGGISLSGGGEFISGFTAGLGGIDGRLGVQINKLVGIYLQPHVAFGSGTVGGISGATGNFAATAMVDFTIINRLFVGAGAGFGVVNNPFGAAVQFRLGGYPVLRFSETMARRKALMVGLDTRIYVIGLGPVVQVMAGVGYEAF